MTHFTTDGITVASVKELLDSIALLSLRSLDNTGTFWYINGDVLLILTYEIDTLPTSSQIRIFNS